MMPAIHFYSCLTNFPQDLLPMKKFTSATEKIAGKYDRVLISHGNGDSKPTTLEDVLKVCQDIRSGNVTDRNFVFLVKHILSQIMELIPLSAMTKTNRRIKSDYSIMFFQHCSIYNCLNN